MVEFNLVPGFEKLPGMAQPVVTDAVNGSVVRSTQP